MVSIFLHFRSQHSKWAVPAFFVSRAASMDATVARIWQLAAPLAETQGLQIIDIELRHEGSRGGRVLRLYLDKDDGPNMEDLSRVSRDLSALLDEHDVVDGAYTLEVSSPGINRPLKVPEHFKRFIGKTVRVRTRELVGGRRSFLGRLVDVMNDRIAVDQDGTRVEIPFAVIEKSNYEHDWSAEYAAGSK